MANWIQKSGGPMHSLRITVKAKQIIDERTTSSQFYRERRNRDLVIMLCQLWSRPLTLFVNCKFESQKGPLRLVLLNSPLMGENARFKNGHARVETRVLKTLACRNGFWTSFKQW